MIIYKQTGDIIDITNNPDYFFEATDEVILNTRDSGNGLRKKVGVESIGNNSIYGDKAFVINTRISFLKDDDAVAKNVIIDAKPLRVDETTMVNPDSGQIVEKDANGVYPIGSITEFLFVWLVLHYGTGQQLLKTMFWGIKQAELRGRFN